ncbi:tryptophan dimethylallyltransferase-domain-containing protein [Xylaria sp. CBS 124048]|nr:tryptophan dimethylallyltransferase-domain-containing protein [Xylaria sp. CBS 124048]
MVDLIMTPFDQINQQVQPADKDRVFWWAALGRSLATLLSSNGYDEEQQLYYLQWFYEAILPSLGPRPTGGKPYHAATFTHDGSHLEYSLNWKEKKATQTIRFTTEPTSLASGTATDRLNQVTAQQVLKRMTEHIPGLDLAKFNTLLAATSVPNEAADQVLASLPRGFPPARVLLAYDLEGGSLVAKAYFNPGHRAAFEKTATKNVVFDAVRKCNGPVGSYDASIKAVDDYLGTFAPEEAPQVTLLSNDCVPDSPSSRLKVYVTGPVNTLAIAKDMFSLRGKLSTPAITEGLKAIQDFWCYAFGLDSSEAGMENKEVLEKGNICVFVYEMKPTTQQEEGAGDPEMDVKMHMPATWLGKTDAQINKVMSGWFAKHGHAKLAARYESDLAAAFPKHDLHDTRSLTHTWISLTWSQKTGLYMTMYYTPKLPQFYFQSN